MPNLKKGRPDHELEEGEIAPQKDNKQQKVAKDPRDNKRGASVDSGDEAEVRRPQRTWALWLELEGAPLNLLNNGASPMIKICTWIFANCQC